MNKILVVFLLCITKGVCAQDLELTGTWHLDSTVYASGQVNLHLTASIGYRFNEDSVAIFLNGKYTKQMRFELEDDSLTVYRGSKIEKSRIVELTDSTLVWEEPDNSTDGGISLRYFSVLDPVSSTISSETEIDKIESDQDLIKGFWQVDRMVLGGHIERDPGVVLYFENSEFIVLEQRTSGLDVEETMRYRLDANRGITLTGGNDGMSMRGTILELSDRVFNFELTTLGESIQVQCKRAEDQTFFERFIESYRNGEYEEPYYPGYEDEEQAVDGETIERE